MRPIGANGLVFATAAALLLASGTASAQQKSEGWDITIGAGPGYHPRFEGSRDYRPTVFPYLDISWRDLLFLSTEDGLGANLLRHEGLTVGPFLQLSQKRKEGADERLRGLGDFHTGLQGGVFANYEWAREQSVFVKLRCDIGNNRSGLFADFGADFTVSFDKSWIGGLRTVLTWADADALQPYFGVSPSQSAASRMPVFTAHAGLRDVTVEPTLTRLLDEHWSVTLRAQYERLLSDAADSPIIRNGGAADQAEIGLTLNYHF
jgi:MipA family protein